MKYEIETYKGQQIVYNDDNDKFECQIELNNQVKNAKRSSLKDVRREIDQFVKANLEFKPFTFLRKSNYSKTFKIFECSAIRTDGKFVISEKDSNCRSYADKKEMGSAMVFDAEIVKELENLYKKLETAQVQYNNSVSDLYDKLIPLDLSAYKTS